MLGGGGGQSGGFSPLAMGAGVLALLLLLNSFKLIDERERGVVLRFGQFNRIMTPGANYKLPWPVESVIVVDATRIQSLEDQVRVLTKDENIVDIKFNVQYQIGDPRLFLFGFRDGVVGSSLSEQGKETLQNAAESAVREVVGNHTLDTVLFDRDKLLIAARQHLQESLEFYQTGLLVTEVNLTDARPPVEVKEAFDEANRAAQDKESSINNANAYASQIVPEARGVALRIKAESQGYQAATIAKAEGDAQRFRQLAGQYRKAPEVTRKRLYLETMQEVLSANPKVMAGRDNNILYLPLNGMNPTTGNAPAEAPLLRLPSVQVNPPPANDTRPDRADGRDEDR